MALNTSGTALLLNIDEGHVAAALQEAAASLEGASGELVLDFSSVRRIDSGAVRALEDIAGVANEKEVKVVLRGVNVDVYKVLELVKLTRKFSFVH